ncbi:MAG TPA: 3-methyl-2-oxobutanoate hydroxymethyltransferase [Thermodesulfobacteriota bacterium]|nr:3-methyl-2-oxobutanoate hydroxymethyltransferase [Thermodesulfobacteriota bacterium]
MERKKITPQDLQARKDQGKKITRVIAYDYPMALLADKAEIDMILVGDSLAMVTMGIKDTLPVTMNEMIHHCKAVTRAVKYAMVIGDLPFLSYQPSVRDAIYNAGRLMKEGGVDAVKLEGGKEFAGTVKAIVDAGIPVVGHIGLTPQMVAKLGGFKVQGADISSARKIITQKLKIPVVGIGSGPYTDGQALNMYDLLGLFDRFTPKFVKKYANLSQDILKALQEYKKEVEEGTFPAEEHRYHIKDEVLQEILKG